MKLTHTPNAVLGGAGVLLAVVAFLTVPTRKEPSHHAQRPPLAAWSSTQGIQGMAMEAIQGALPDPLPGQKTKRCDPQLGEVERNGGCWMLTMVPTPCPEGKLWEDGGRCWRPIPVTKQEPTTGDPRTAPLAGPADR